MSMPYFEGDFWPNVIEDCIRDAEKEENERKKHEEALIEEDDDDIYQTDDCRSKKNKFVFSYIYNLIFFLSFVIILSNCFQIFYKTMKLKI